MARTHEGWQAATGSMAAPDPPHISAGSRHCNPGPEMSPCDSERLVQTRIGRSRSMTAARSVAVGLWHTVHHGRSMCRAPAPHRAWEVKEKETPGPHIPPGPQPRTCVSPQGPSQPFTTSHSTCGSQALRGLQLWGRPFNRGRQCPHCRPSPSALGGSKTAARQLPAVLQLSVGLGPLDVCLGSVLSCGHPVAQQGWRSHSGLTHELGVRVWLSTWAFLSKGAEVPGVLQELVPGSPGPQLPTPSSASETA